ncbi:hypothetical protein ABEW32_16200 [Paenibacillus jamilae]|uniref:hypothetical protein n=1 Tax=Paenibacillus jamilae TaxID=114136 RepID=UPI003D2CA3F6
MIEKETSEERYNRLKRERDKLMRALEVYTEIIEMVIKHHQYHADSALYTVETEKALALLNELRYKTSAELIIVKLKLGRMLYQFKKFSDSVD